MLGTWIQKSTELRGWVSKGTLPSVDKGKLIEQEPGWSLAKQCPSIKPQCVDWIQQVNPLKTHRNGSSL